MRGLRTHLPEVWASRSRDESAAVANPLAVQRPSSPRGGLFSLCTALKANKQQETSLCVCCEFKESVARHSGGQLSTPKVIGEGRRIEKVTRLCAFPSKPIADPLCRLVQELGIDGCWLGEGDVARISVSLGRPPPKLQGHPPFQHLSSLIPSPPSPNLI